MRLNHDDRAWDALHVIDAAAELEAIWIVLENVLNYVDLDSKHGVYSKVVQHARTRGFTVVRVLRPKHNRCGGETYRHRVLIVLCRTAALAHLNLKPIFDITYNNNVIAEPTVFTLDRTRDWSVYGRITEERQSSYLQYTTTEPVPGAGYMHSQGYHQKSKSEVPAKNLTF